MSSKAQDQPVSHEAIAEQFQNLRSQTSQLSSSLNDILAELAVGGLYTASLSHELLKVTVCRGYDLL